MSSRYLASAAAVALATGLLLPAAASAVPAVFFNDDLVVGRQRLVDVIGAADAAYNAANPATPRTSTIFETNILNNSTDSNGVFAVTSGSTSIWVRTTRLGSAATNTQTGFSGGDGFTNWSNSYSGGFGDAEALGYTLSFFTDAGLTTPAEMNAVGLNTNDWGTCCTFQNPTPDGSTADASQVYLRFLGAGGANDLLLLGGIENTINSREHFIGAVNDRNFFNSVVVIANGNGEFFGAGGQLLFSTVALNSVPPGLSDIDGEGLIPGDGSGPTGIYWDGGNPANANNGIVDGGDGVWAYVDPTFTTSSGATNSVYADPENVIFSAAPGTVTVDGEGGQVQATGLEFTVDGYTITGDSIELVDGSAPAPMPLLALLSTMNPGADVVVGDGTPAGADMMATIDSDLFGNVDLVKLGLGTLVLNGDNSFLNLIISEGTAAIGSDTGAGAGAIIIANDATLAAGGPNVVLENPVITEGNGLVDSGEAGNVFTLDGDISGAGSISHVGFGNLVLNGDNSYTNLGINRGTVTFGSDTAGGIGGIAINNGTTLAAGVSGLVVTNDVETTGAGTIDSGSGVFTLAGSVGNLGSIDKIGSGKLIFTGDNDYAGPTTVTAGTLEVNGNNGISVVTVKSGATLGGNGTVGTTNVLAGGTIAPGNSIGKLIVNGDLNQAAASTYAVELGASGVGDRIVVGGAATISPGARVNVINTTGSPFALGSKWWILETGGGRTGTYTLTGANRVSQFIEVVGFYEPNNAYLTVNQTSSFISAADTPNQFGSALGSDTPGNGALYQAIAYLPNEAAAQDAFDQTSGELHASLRSVTFEDSRFVREAIYNHNKQAVDPRIGLWFAGFGSWGAGQDDGNAARVDRSIGGFFLGLDALKSENAALGIMTGYSTANINVHDRNSHASTDDLYVGIYGSYDVSGFSLTGAVTNTWRWVGTRRSIAFEGFQDSVQADYLINMFQAFGEASYQFRFSGIGVAPFASFAYVSVDAKPFSEFGGTAALYADDNNNDDYWTTLLGLRFDYGLPINGDTFSLQASAGWRYVFEGDTLSATNLRFGQGPDFTVYGTPIAQNAIATSFTIQTKLTDRADLDIGYSGQYGDGWNDSGVRAALRLRF